MRLHARILRLHEMPAYLLHLCLIDSIKARRASPWPCDEDFVVGAPLMALVVC